MGRFRSLISQSPAIVISVLAATLSLGGGAFASTHLVAGPSQGSMHTLRLAHSQAAHNTASNLTTGVSWTPIVLQNGWVSSNATFTSGNPKVALQGNIVYLSGSLHQSSGSSTVFGFLPSTFRPTHNMWITIYTYDGTSGTLYIAQDGTMELFSNSSCSGTLDSAQCYSSLATVSYPINS
jgi:hypothetical protein